MKKILQLLAIFLLVTVSCKKVTEQLIPVANTIKITETDSKDSIIIKAAHVVPTANQYEALKNEFIAFIHFGPNTFTRMEWGNGMEDPKIFNLQNLETDQWCETIKSAGMKMVIITVKHHDGFVLWQSRYTKHGIMSSPFQDGKGDILKELSASCKKYGLKLGIYLSPADLYQIESKDGLYGNLSEYTERVIPRSVEGRPFKNKTTFTAKVDDYNEYMMNQLFEVLTEYGSISEVWFDGATPKSKGGQTYNYLAWKKLIKALAPKAVVFGKQDIRWCGNEGGRTRDTEWNVIPYKTDLKEMNRFGDLTNKDLGSREKLYQGKYLHYQQAETDTSIREGWFYRDDTNQKVRSADDVFDIYERSVGGNATLLLNIPPNREGRFSPEDVRVLNEVGKRIRATYGTNLFKNATGPKKALDANLLSYELLNSENNSLIITTPSPVTINRLIIQEAITTHSERIEKHAVDAWLNNEWTEIAAATNVGYKRILRFAEVTSDKFRIRVLASRLDPAISNVTAHYYKTRPPELSIYRTLEGILKIEPKKHTFGWNQRGNEKMKKAKTSIEIRFTTDGSEPNRDSQLYKDGIFISADEVKAVAMSKDEMGSIASTVFGILKKDWKIIGVDSAVEKNESKKAIDENANTFWKSNSKASTHFIEIDLGREHTLNGFAYTLQTKSSEGMIEQGIVKISSNGKNWKVVERFKFGNLINDPVKRSHYFKKSVKTRYIKIESTVIASRDKSAAIAELDFF